MRFRKRMTEDESALFDLTTEEKHLTARWYSKMSGQVGWSGDSEKEHLEREFGRLGREIAALQFSMMPQE